jgi:hypothetical protein
MTSTHFRARVSGVPRLISMDGKLETRGKKLFSNPKEETGPRPSTRALRRIEPGCFGFGRCVSWTSRLQGERPVLNIKTTRLGRLWRRGVAPRVGFVTVGRSSLISRAAEYLTVYWKTFPRRHSKRNEESTFVVLKDLRDSSSPSASQHDRLSEFLNKLLRALRSLGRLLHRSLLYP